ncbi:AraC family transcriptional regulator [uncultured Pseudacidovorax sp.]|uniref:AraC family transcriptional regulator n=1 Tax=uncultured Pseudacidovorax sp. TaxID=679313 RepID=UPI0025EA41AD|nr:AraC family transcriptional regulator [uncultured Pseudacidovorax sp.]
MTPSYSAGAPSAAPAPLDPADTHGIPFWPEHRFVLDSRGIGWREVYTSLAAERSWQRCLPPVRHVALAYCVHGHARVQRTVVGDGPGRECTLPMRGFGIIPPDRECRMTLAGTPDIQLIYLHRDLLDRVAADAFDLAPDQVTPCFDIGLVDPLLEQLAAALLAAVRDPLRPAQALYADTIAHTMALHLLRHHLPHRRAVRAECASQPVSRAGLQHVLDYIEAHLGRPLTLAVLAREARMGVHAFGTAFTRAMGVTPHAWVVQQRVERARRELEATDAPVADIAHRLGFSSQSHLTTAFKRRTGLTPAAYRR